MNTIIAQKLSEQLRVLNNFLNEYDNELAKNILGKTILTNLSNSIKDAQSMIQHTLFFC